MVLNRFFVVIFIFSVVTACGVAERGSVPVHEPSEGPALMSVDRVSNARSDLYNELQSAYRKWRGTPYALGGSSLSGVDCSAFTQNVFQDHFGRELPRHTTEQLRVGEGVRRGFLRTGDLVFFRTARSTLHVGIYMGEGTFLHASVSQGVTLSEIGDPYWATRYIGARRVL